MSADEMKNKALEATKAETMRIHAEATKKQVSDSDQLFNHLEQLIHKAANLGKFSIDKVSFPSDRFRPKVVEDVIERLEKNGYRVQLTANNAMQQVVFNISW